METWRAIDGYEGGYEVSDLGRVRSIDRRQVKEQRTRSGRKRRILHLLKGRVLKAGIASNGYPTVALSGVTHTVHSLVAAAFLGRRPRGMQVRHKDGNRRNAKLANLDYGTPSDNRKDAERHGTVPRGSGYRSAKLNERTARIVRGLRGRVSQSVLARRFKVSPAAIQAVHDGRTWTHV